jgi:deoxyribodipyrimidine photo-lyase
MPRSADSAPVLIWFRRDLRLADNHALAAARETGRPLVALFVLDEDDPHPPGGATRWWLHHSLAALGTSLSSQGLTLTLRHGRAADIVPQAVAESGALAVYWNRLYDPYAVARDSALKESLKASGIEAKSFAGALLHEPWRIRNKSDQPFRVFTPFWKTVIERGAPPFPKPEPKTLVAGPGLHGEDLGSWRLLPVKPDWAGGLRAAWTPGEAGARAQLKRFIGSALKQYKTARDLPDRAGTSRLSPHLHFGEIGPAQIWHAIQHCMEAKPSTQDDGWKFLAELGWREFSHHLLFHFPTLPEANFRPEFDAFPWQPDRAALAVWQRGRTGYPIVDAGMRELWQTGWMHNRVRMIAASFLIKHLLQDWREGAAWFWDTLVDADLANNSASWQWVAGSGADAAPYFRIFNPVLQGEKFDPDGGYVRRFVPELAALPNEWLHKPWAAPAPVLKAAKVVLGKTYPEPIVDHAAARSRALAAFKAIRHDET